MRKISPFLWFDNNAEEAVNFYVSIFRNSRIVNFKRHGENGPVFIATFEIEGQTLMALNGGPLFKFTEAISLFVDCDTQEEVDFLWENLSAGGCRSQCGWLKDKYGLSWQIIPKALGELMNDPDPAKSQRVMKAMLKMSKIDIAALKRAYEGE